MASNVNLMIVKIAMLRLNTKNSQIIKQYYIKMEELIRLYAQYTRYLYEKEKEQMYREMNSLQLIMEEMKIANLKQEEERKLDRLMLTESRNMLRIMGIEIKTVKNNNNNLIDQNNELLERVDEVLHKVDVVQTKLNISVEDRAPQPDKNKRRERFLLLKRNDENYPYYTIRAQDINAKKALKRQKDMFSDVTILLDLICHPNTKTFYVRIKDGLKKKGVEFHLCEISIEDSQITEQDLVEAMMKINDEKREIN